jgi:hypothetical protein
MNLYHNTTRRHKTDELDMNLYRHINLKPPHRWLHIEKTRISKLFIQEKLFFLSYNAVTTLPSFRDTQHPAPNRHLLWISCFVIYEGVSKSFRTGRVERELQTVQLSALDAVVSLFCESV